MTYRKPKLRINSDKVAKTVTNSAKFLTGQHYESSSATRRNIRLMSTQQSINFILASSELRVRRLRSANKAHARLVATGKEDGPIRTAYEWVVDCIVVTLSLIWNTIRMILMLLMMIVIRALLIVFFTVVVFYLLYLFITS